MAVLVGTDRGLRTIEGEAVGLAGHRIDALHRADGGWWLLADRRTVWFLPPGAGPQLVAELDEGIANCLLPGIGSIVVGASEARLYRVGIELRNGAIVSTGVELDGGFASAPGRRDWYTPWGGPPDVRSMAADVNGNVYVNVHVGGIVRRDETGRWQGTLDIDADVHEVAAHPQRPGAAFAATARGLATTSDGADTWEFHTSGLHAAYCRAVAVRGDRVLVSCSRSFAGGESAVYRATSDGSTLTRCTAGLPEWFSTNIDTGCLGLGEDVAVIGDEAGTVYVSEDGGETWRTAGEGLPRIRCVAVE